MARRRRRLGDGLATLGGARADVLAMAPGARPRFVAMGGVLLSTGGLAVLSATFAVHMALGAPWPFALAAGLGWGFVVVNLDRMLVVGMAHDASLRRNLLLGLPRIALALVLGVVIATPLTLQVFAKEIDTEVVTMQAEAADAHRASLEEDGRFAGLPALRESVAADEAIVASGGQGDPALATLRDELAADQAAYDAAVATSRQFEAKAQCELDGTCGTGDAGTGEAYVQARARADAQARTVDQAREQLDAAGAAVAAAELRSADLAAASLETDRTELARLTAELDRLQAAFDDQNERSAGILARLDALDRLGERSTTLATAHYMLALLFMCVEILPVLMKLLLNFGPPSAYDRLVALRDSGDVDIEQLQQGSRREVAQAKEELLVLAEKERLGRQREAILARRRTAVAQTVARVAGQTTAPPAEAPNVVAARPMWDTGPIRELARNAAVRTVRTVRRRPADREPAAV